jgi:predicted amidohydrolase
MFRKKAELAFVPSLWCRQDAGKGIKFNKNAEIELVNSVATARAFENEMNIAFINGAGKFSINGSVGNLIGHTQIASPFLGTVGRLDHNEEGMLIKQIDTAILPVAEDAYKIREDLKN